MLLCSHLLADVEDVCDRIAIVYHGKLRAEGRVEDLLVRSEERVLTLDKPDEALLAELQNRAGGFSVRVDHPRQRLEHYFREIVAKADASDKHPPQEAAQEETQGTAQ